MVNKAWLESYPAGMPAEIDPDRFSSIPDLLEKAAGKFADKPAFHNLGRSMTYAELERQSRAFAAFLQGLPGMAKGERVAVMMPNLLQYPVALFGILRAGMVVVNVNPLYTPRELEHQLKDSGARAIVIVENFASVLQQVIGSTPVEHVITTRIGDMLPAPKRWIVNLVISKVKKMVPAWHIERAIGFREALARGAAAPLQPVEVTREDLAFLQYTGGTTGVSKGAMLTHRNVLANMEQTGAWVSLIFEEGTEIAIAPLPLYHIFCLTATLSFMKWGSLNVLITNPRDLPDLVQGARAVAVDHHDRRQYAVQRAPQYHRVRSPRLFLAEGGHRRRRRGAEGGGRALAAGDRMQHHRRLRTDRGIAGRVRQSHRTRPGTARSAFRIRPPSSRSVTRSSPSCRRGPVEETSRSSPARSACADRR